MLPACRRGCYPLGCRPLRVYVQASRSRPRGFRSSYPFILKDEPGRRKKGMARIKQLLEGGELVRVFAAGQLLSPKLIEIVGEHGGFDALWLDAEHAGIGMKEVELATLAARVYGMDPFVRLPATDYAAVMRPLEAGAGGLMISMVSSAAEAERAVRWAKFWPRGERGLNGGNRDGRFGLTPLSEYTEAANASTFVGIQIETAGALAQVAEIAAVP